MFLSEEYLSEVRKTLLIFPMRDQVEQRARALACAEPGVHAISSSRALSKRASERFSVMGPSIG